MWPRLSDGEGITGALADELRDKVLQCGPVFPTGKALTSKVLAPQGLRASMWPRLSDGEGLTNTGAIAVGTTLQCGPVFPTGKASPARWRTSCATRCFNVAPSFRRGRR